MVFRLITCSKVRAKRRNSWEFVKVAHEKGIEFFRCRGVFKDLTTEIQFQFVGSEVRARHIRKWWKSDEFTTTWSGVAGAYNRIAAEGTTQEVQGIMGFWGFTE